MTKNALPVARHTACEGMHFLAETLAHSIDKLCLNKAPLTLKLIDSPVSGTIPELRIVDEGMAACGLFIRGSILNVEGHELLQIALQGPALTDTGARFNEELVTHWENDLTKPLAVLRSSSLNSSAASIHLLTAHTPWISVMTEVLLWVERWLAMTPLQREISRRLAIGQRLVPVAGVEAQLAQLGYELDADDFVYHPTQIVSGVGAGESYPSVTTSIFELDTGLSFANVESRKDVNFKRLQAFRRSPSVFALIDDTHILDL